MEALKTRKPGPGPFRAVGRKTIRVSREGLVKTSFVNDRQLPLVIEPRVEGLQPAAWAASNREFLAERLGRHGGVLLRGFDIPDVGSFEALIRSAWADPLPYSERSSPRSQVAGNIYTSTDYPPRYPIFLHNEQSYNKVFPLKIFFYCVTPATTGGATPIADARKVLARIDPGVRRRFEEEGYLYVRNFGDGFGLTWQSAFQTDDPATVEAYCRDNDIEFEWKSGDRLRTRQRRRVVGRSPLTGEESWFNHLTFFHVATLPPAIRDAMLDEFAAEDLPNNTCYGDGSPIEDEVMEELREIYRSEAVSVPWRQGDVLILDNMLVAHGREPYGGPRKVVVGMAEPCAWEGI